MADDRKLALTELLRVGVCVCVCVLSDNLRVYLHTGKAKSRARFSGLILSKPPP